jgi:hypothetical protein
MKTIAYFVRIKGHQEPCGLGPGAQYCQTQQQAFEMAEELNLSIPLGPAMEIFEPVRIEITPINKNKSYGKSSRRRSNRKSWWRDPAVQD